jgi:hypothetical protein
MSLLIYLFIFELFFGAGEKLLDFIMHITMTDNCLIINDYQLITSPFNCGILG